MFKFPFLLFASLVCGLPEEEVKGKFAIETDGQAPVGNECESWTDAVVAQDEEPGDGSHAAPYFAILDGGLTGALSGRCGEKLALFAEGSTSGPVYIKIAASDFNDATDLKIGQLACGDITGDGCDVDFGNAYHLPTLASLDVSGATFCPGFEGAVAGDGSGDGVENAIWAYVDSPASLFVDLPDCGRVWTFGSKFFVVAGTLSDSDDGITLQISSTDCTTISCSNLTDYAEWSDASYELVPAATTSQETETTPAEEETTPAEGETTPAEGETTPAEGETTPAEGETTPAEGDTTTTEETASEEDGSVAAAAGFVLLAFVA